jgi:uncharacterized protein (DUF2141 family)
MISPAQRRSGIEAARGSDVHPARVFSTGLLVSAFLMVSGTQATSAPGAAGTTRLIVDVSGFRNAKGKVDALLFVGPDGFPDKDSKAFDKDEVSIDPKTMSAQIVFKNIPPGFAAVTVLHDENMNRKMDKNFIGIPKEGYGTSNNPKKARHNPRWDEANFAVTQPEQTIQIRLIYW